MNKRINSFPTAVMAISQNAVDFENKADSSLGMLDMLYAEVEELRGALDLSHADAPAYELIQIGGIVINMLKQYPKSVILSELEKIRVRHGIGKSTEAQA